MWAWGNRDQGECGTGSEPPPEEAKKPLLEPKATDATALQGQVVAVAAGEGHSLALDNLGNVYAWGRTREGQAGRVSREPQHAPLLVQSLSHEIVTSVACGASSCFAVAASGRCYMWGSVLQRSGGRLHHDAAGYGRSFSELSEATQRMLKLSVRPRIACSDWPWLLALNLTPTPTLSPTSTSPLIPNVTSNPNHAHYHHPASPSPFRGKASLPLARSTACPRAAAAVLVSYLDHENCQALASVAEGSFASRLLTACRALSRTEDGPDVLAAV